MEYVALQWYSDFCTYTLCTGRRDVRRRDLCWTKDLTSLTTLITVYLRCGCRTCNSHPGRIQGGGRHRLHLLALYWLYTNEGRAQPSVLARIIRTLKTLSAGGASGAQRRWPRRPFITSLSIAKVHCLNIGTRIRSVSLFLMVYKDIYVYEVNFNISVLKPFI